MSGIETPRPRIAPSAVVRQGLASTVAGFDALLRIGWFPALLLTAAGALMEPDAPYLDAEGTIVITPRATMILVLMALMATALTAMVATAWQREMLQPDARATRRWHFRLGRRELFYMLVAFFLMGLVFMGMATAPGAFQALQSGNPLGAVIMMIGPFAAILVVSRSVMVLPSIALDRGGDIAQVWRAAEGNTLRIAIALFLGVLPMIAGELLMLEMAAAVMASDLGLLAELALMSFVLAVPVVAVTGVLYALLVDPGLQGALSRPREAFFRS
jgi:hypothetical protein